MHRSRVSTLLIDTSGDALPGFVTAVQAVDDEPRYHLDIESDDIEAEVTRLLALGATEVSSWLECRTLRAPSGHLLCVIPVHSDSAFFAAHAQRRRDALSTTCAILCSGRSAEPEPRRPDHVRPSDVLGCTHA